MADKFSKVHEWYTKSPKEFRKEVFVWLSDHSKGGELGQWIIQLFQYRNRGLKLCRGMGKALKSRTARGIAIVLIITSIGVLIKKDSQTTIYEIIFDNLESIALGAAGVIFLLEIQDRQKQDHYEAWQVINSARGQAGNGGRIQALEDLNNDGVALEGVTAPYADLSGIDLHNANLRRANFRKAQLDGANLQGANLSDANLQGANLRGAQLQGAILDSVNLQGADLNGAQLQKVVSGSANLQRAILAATELQGAILWEAQMQGAILAVANLYRADLRGAQLQDAFFEMSQLQGSILYGSNLENAIFLFSDLRNAIGLNHNQFVGENAPLICASALPENIELEGGKDRDCDKLPAIIMSKYPFRFSSIENAKYHIGKMRRKKWK